MPPSKTDKLQQGQGLVEYALILVLVSIVVIVILGVTGKSIASAYCNVIVALKSSCATSASSLNVSFYQNNTNALNLLVSDSSGTIDTATVTAINQTQGVSATSCNHFGGVGDPAWAGKYGCSFPATVHVGDVIKASVTYNSPTNGTETGSVTTTAQ